MNTKKTIIAVVVAFLLSNVLTTIWYTITDTSNYVPFRREEINYGLLVLNHLIYAGLLVYLFPVYYEKYLKRSYAFVFGCVTAAIMFIPQALVVRAIWTVDVNLMFFLNTVAHLLIGGIIGWVISFIYGKRTVRA
ncbi:hypothetical protein QQ008_20170 [Fulvivirgaceae bacterium BMA10]|uniref:Uncharacterized protein n=1 Tax=Splendidivirga corallicola TaxID=3051826 RepID=A0ABT8KUT3_9BACT|nr:hypothetical protein [Fulvivirgaceae bacterium BMA10]